MDRQDYVTHKKRFDGYYAPCYATVDQESLVCKDYIEPMYRVFNQNIDKVVTTDKSDAHSYLIPKSVFDHMVQDEAFVAQHFFYDTHDKLDIDNKKAVFSPAQTPNPGTCIRVDPCDGPAMQGGVCCPNLLAPNPAPMTHLDRDLSDQMLQFNANVDNNLNFVRPSVGRAKPKEQEPTYMQLSSVEPVMSNHLVKWGIIMFSIFFIIICFVLLIYLAINK